MTRPNIPLSILSTLSILIGIILLINSISHIWNHIYNPNTFIIVWIPYSRLIIQGFFGLLAFFAGSILLLNIEISKLFYKILAYSLILFGLDVILYGDIMTGFGLRISIFSFFRLYSIFYILLSYIILIKIDHRYKKISYLLFNGKNLKFIVFGIFLVIVPDMIGFMFFQFKN